MSFFRDGNYGEETASPSSHGPWKRTPQMDRLVSRANTQDGGTARPRNPSSSESEVALPKQGSSRNVPCSMSSESFVLFTKNRSPARRRAATGSHSAMRRGPTSAARTRRRRREGDSSAARAARMLWPSASGPKSSSGRRYQRWRQRRRGRWSEQHRRCLRGEGYGRECRWEAR